jgi:phenylacetate-CoA ligase
MVDCYWEPSVELISKERLRKLQQKRLSWMLRYVYQNSRFYKRRFDEEGFKPDSFNRLEDMKRVPLTTKDDLRLHTYPYGGEFLCVPREELVFWHATSGTTGKPTIGPYTYKDYETWMNLMARCYVAAGVRKGDIVMNIYGYGLFTGGLGFHQSAAYVGATVIPWSVGRTKALIETLRDFKVTVMTGTPSYQHYICQILRQTGVDPEHDLNLRITLPGAEIWTDNMRHRIEEGLALKEHGGGARNVYGATELCGPGVGIECVHEKGFHFWTDHFFLEILDPKTLEPVEPGEEGEMVVSHLTRQGMPLIRYRMRDLTIIDDEPCECERKAFPRCCWIRGRVDDVIHFKGTKIYPSVIQQVLLEFGGIDEYQVVVDKTVMPYQFIVKVEGKMDVAKMGILKKELANALYVNPEVELMPAGSLPRFEGKANRIVVRDILVNQ